MNDNENKHILDRFIKDWRSGTRNLKLKKAIGREYAWLWYCLRNETWDKTWKVRGTYKEFGIVAGENPKTVYRAVIKWEKNQLINKVKLKRGSGIEIEFLIYPNRLIEMQRQSEGMAVISYLAEERNRTPVSSIYDDNKERNGTPMSTISRETGHPCPQGRTPVSSISKNGKSESPLNLISYQPKNGNNGTLKETIKNKVFKERKKKPALLAKKTAKYCLDYYLKEFPQQACTIDFDGKWVRDTRLMLEKDGWEPEQIRTLWKYARNHHFWSGPIGSPGDLRKNIGGIERDYKREQKKAKFKADDLGGQKDKDGIEDERQFLRDHIRRDLANEDGSSLLDNLLYVSQHEAEYPNSPKVLTADLQTQIDKFMSSSEQVKWFLKLKEK